MMRIVVIAVGGAAGVGRRRYYTIEVRTTYYSNMHGTHKRTPRLMSS
jgi:hypothetical protein